MCYFEGEKKETVFEKQIMKIFGFWSLNKLLHIGCLHAAQLVWTMCSAISEEQTSGTLHACIETRRSAFPF